MSRNSAYIPAGARAAPQPGRGPVLGDPGDPQVPVPRLCAGHLGQRRPARATRQHPPTLGHDPHGDPGNTPAAQEQAMLFLLTGEVFDTCGGLPCVGVRTSG
jgi:hypothetical protein